MLFPSTAYLNLCFVFAGAAFGSFLCIIAGKIFKKKYFKFRLSLAFLLLSAAVIFAVFMLLECGGIGRHEFFSAVKNRAALLCIYTAAGMLCSAFLRSVFPAVSVVYIAFTLCCGITLYGKMPLPREMTLTVSRSFIRDEMCGTEYPFAESGGEVLCRLAFDVYNLDDRFVLPLPYVWYRFCGTESPVPGTEEILLPQKAGGFKKAFLSLVKKILGEPHRVYVNVPVQNVYPSLYSLKINVRGVKFSAVLEKII